MNEKLSLICYSNSQRHGELVNEEICMSNWSHLRGHDWSYLLEHQPRFADRCGWSKLEGCDWAPLLGHRVCLVLYCLPPGQGGEQYNTKQTLCHRRHNIYCILASGVARCVRRYSVTFCRRI